MNLAEAIQSAKEGNFVTHEHFSSYESMHFYNGKLYYEDGAVVTENFLVSQEFTRNGKWILKYDSSKVDIEKLDEMHKQSNGYMLSSSSYEDCIVK